MGQHAHSVSLAEFGAHSPFHSFRHRLHEVQATVGTAPVGPLEKSQNRIPSSKNSITHHVGRRTADVVPVVEMSRVGLLEQGHHYCLLLVSR
jgi:hypothetical protein